MNRRSFFRLFAGAAAAAVVAPKTLLAKPEPIKRSISLIKTGEVSLDPVPVPSWYLNDKSLELQPHHFNCSCYLYPYLDIKEGKVKFAGDTWAMAPSPELCVQSATDGRVPLGPMVIEAVPLGEGVFNLVGRMNGETE